MSITSEEVNVVVYRYLVESGFQHSAFTFGLESQTQKTTINGVTIPPGALVSMLQKGLQYMEAEVSITEDGSILDEKDIANLSLVDAVVHHSSNLKQRPSQTKVEPTSSQSVAQDNDGSRAGEQASKEDVSSDSMEVDTGSAGGAGSSLDLPASKVITLRGHQSEVYTCVWSPLGDSIVSGSGDSTARLWRLEEDNLRDVSPLILPHEPVGTASQECNRDVTTVHWNSEGSLLATGSYDGVARLWTVEGTLKSTLVHHSGPIFALKWNSKGNLIVTVGVDKTAVVWDVLTEEVKQQFSFHKAPTLDVDWQNNTCFASCSTDKLIHVCKVGMDKPVRTFQGHKKGVNTVKWDPSGSLLASCSDDHTAKVWNTKQDSWLHDLCQHSGDIYDLQWSRTGPGAPPFLATASFDSTIRLWEMEKGSCIRTLRKHADPVYSIAFTPDGKFLASGAYDRWLYVWSVQDGEVVKQYRGPSGIFDLSWDKDGGKLVACFSNYTICVLDLRGL